ncbi:GDSL esterase/lipase At3g48460-like [Tasmannia lanceolata]|uniref:GDSL esterase/lipase At3g48460-like n=1 Tax=Tasmannia lanceolata TaxID=3420 RepID=UPI004062F6D0
MGCLVFIFLIFSLTVAASPNHPINPEFKKIYSFGDSLTDTGNPYPSSSVINPPKFKKIYSFGDSLTDTGNPYPSSPVINPPYGETFFGKPTGRVSDGRIVVDFLAERLSLPYLPGSSDTKANFTSGVNFAKAGSMAIDFEFFKSHNATKGIIVEDSLVTQRRWFEDFADKVECARKSPPECKKVMESTLFWLGEMGANDYAIANGTSISPVTIRNKAVSSIIELVKDVLARGGKFVIVQGLLTVPGTVKPSDFNAHSRLLNKKLHQVRKQNPSAIIIYAKFLEAYLDIKTNPGNYGFEVIEEPCCGDKKNFCGMLPNSSVCVDPKKYIMWDSAHFTEAMNARLADHFFRQNNYTEPPFETLFNAS